MTWPGFLALVAVIGTLLYAWHQVRPLLERRVSVTESKAKAEIEAAKPVVPPPPTPREALPATVRMIAEQWRDGWAREQAMDYYCEVYDEIKDWNAVTRMAMAHQAGSLQEKPPA